MCRMNRNASTHGNENGPALFSDPPGSRNLHYQSGSNFFLNCSSLIYLNDLRIPPGNRLEKLSTAYTALRLGRFFGTSAQFWLGLQMDYDLDSEEDRKGELIKTEVHQYAAVG